MMRFKKYLEEKTCTECRKVESSGLQKKGRMKDCKEWQRKGVKIEEWEY